MTAKDILFNIQSEYSICVTVDGATTVDRYPFGGGDVEVRLLGGLVFTESIPRSFQPSVNSTLGNILVAHSENHRLERIYNKSLKGQPYQIDICGVINKGLGTEQTFTFENRFNFYSGKMNPANWSANKMLYSFGSIGNKLDALLLDNIRLNGDEVTSNDISFSLTSATLAESNGEIDIDVSRSSLTSATAPLSIAFDNTVTDLAIAVESVVSDTEYTSFSFDEISSTVLRSTTGIDVEISIENNVDSSQTMTIDFGAPVHQMDWIFRGFDTTYVSNWSIEPDEPLPAQNNDTNTTLTWSNFGGATHLTFTVSGITSPFDIVSEPDRKKRAQIRFGAKLWPLRIVERKKLPTVGSFSVAPAVAPPSLTGDYVWSEASISSLDLAATFSTVSAVDPIVITVENNRVTFANDNEGLTLVFNRAYVNPANDDSKIALAPVSFGSVKNVTLQGLGVRQYFLPFTSISELRNNGVVVPEETVLATYQANVTNNVSSFYIEQLTPLTAKVFVSGDLGVITADYGIGDTLGAIIQYSLCPKASIDFGSVDALVTGMEAQWHFDAQVTVGQALDQLLSPINCFREIINGELVVKSRQLYSTAYDKTFSDKALAYPEITKLNIGNELDRYHSLKIGYNRNWTIQNDVDGYNNAYTEIEQSSDAIKYIDYPTNTIESGSKERFQGTCLVQLIHAQEIMKHQDTEQRRQLPVDFYLRNDSGDLENNEVVQIDSNILPKGMFTPESIQLETDNERRFVRGVWYGDEL